MSNRRRPTNQKRQGKGLRRAATDVVKALASIATHNPCGHEWGGPQGRDHDFLPHLCDVDKPGHTWHVCTCGQMTPAPPPD